MPSKKEKKEQNMSVMKKLNDITSGLVYGIDQDFYEKDDKDSTQIRGIINKINRNFKQNTGDNIIEFFNKALAYQQKDENSENLNNKGNLVEINKIIEDPENRVVNDIFFLELDRISYYSNYKVIYDAIPQAAQALDTFVDNILSPDDFSKIIFNLSYDSISIKNSSVKENIQDKVIRNLKEINSNYKIEDMVQRIVRDTLKFGDQFVAVIKIEKEINKMLLTEDKIFGLEDPKLHQEKNEIDLNDIVISEESIKDFEEIFVAEKKNLNEAEIRDFIVTSINNNVIIEEDKAFLMEDTYEFQQGFEKEKQKKNLDIKLNGSIIKILEPEKVVKLYLDGINYGYYYIEKVSDESFGQTLSKERGYMTQPYDQLANKDIKNNFILDVFVKGIAKKIDKPFISKNKEFKNTIYHLLRQNFISDKKIKITYLSPNEVVHFKVNDENNDGYGISIYKKILFTAKLYLATLTSTLMQKLIRAPQKRLFYVDVGLDNDVENAIQSFVRDIKTREIKIGDLKDINTVMNAFGQFHDLYIPTINGEKPIQVDTMEGLDTDINNDFMEYLLKTMLSGMGVPATFLNYADEVEFVKSLSMQNGKFIRSIITFQKRFGENFSEFYRRIYQNDYMNTDNDTFILNKEETNKKENKKINEGIFLENSKEEKIKNKRSEEENSNVDLEKILVNFPSPSSLNMTNTLDQINNARDVIEFIVNSFLGEEAPEAKKRFAKRDVAKELIPSLNWDKYEEIINNSLKNYVKDKLSGGETETDQMGGGTNMGGTSDMGDETDMGTEEMGTDQMGGEQTNAEGEMATAGEEKDTEGSEPSGMPKI
jgi:hypothetical protein